MSKLSIARRANKCQRRYWLFVVFLRNKGLTIHIQISKVNSDIFFGKRKSSEIFKVFPNLFPNAFQ